MGYLQRQPARKREPCSAQNGCASDILLSLAILGSCTLFSPQDAKPCYKNHEGFCLRLIVAIDNKHLFLLFYSPSRCQEGRQTKPHNIKTSLTRLPRVKQITFTKNSTVAYPACSRFRTHVIWNT